MNTKVTIEANTSKIVLTPQNDFEKDVIEKCKNKEYRIIATADYSSHPYNSSNHRIELLLSENAGTIDLYPQLKAEYETQLALIQSIFDKVSKLKSSKAIEELKTEIETYLYQPSIQY